MCIHLSLHIPNKTHLLFIIPSVSLTSAVPLSPGSYISFHFQHTATLSVMSPALQTSNQAHSGGTWEQIGTLLYCLCEFRLHKWYSEVWLLIRGQGSGLFGGCVILLEVLERSGVTLQRPMARGKLLVRAPLCGAQGPAYLWAPPENCFLIKIVLSPGPGPLY